MSSMKEVSKQVSIIVFGSLAFCACFYYFYESMNEKNRHFLFGWASTGLCELLLVQTTQLRMSIHNSSTSISLWATIRFMSGATSYFFWFLLGIRGTNDEKDWPTIITIFLLCVQNTPTTKEDSHHKGICLSHWTTAWNTYYMLTVAEMLS